MSLDEPIQKGISQNYIDSLIDDTRKETAKEIFEHIVDGFLMREENKYFFKKWLQERYGVEVEE